MARSLILSFGALDVVNIPYLFIYASPPSSAGRTRNAKRNFKLIKALDLGSFDPPFVSYDATADYLARYGAWPAGSRIFVTVRTCSSRGIVSSLVDATCVSS